MFVPLTTNLNKMTKRNLRNADVWSILTLLNNPTLQSMAELNQRTIEIMDLAARGEESFEKIGERYGISDSRVSDIYRKALSKTSRILNKIVSDIDIIDKLQRQNAELTLKYNTLQAKVANFAINSQDLPIELDSAISAQSIFHLNLPQRAYNCLKAADIQLIGDLIKYSKKDLKRIRNMGEGSLCEIETALAKMGLNLKVN